jgi:hypothetical protein
MTKTDQLPLDADDIGRAYDQAGFDALSDTQLFDLAARAIAVPRQSPANSFVLHAPLELMARRLLLPLVPPSERRSVRERMLWVAAKYQAADMPIEAPRTCEFATLDVARRALLDAIENGDLETADAAASWHVEHGPTSEVVRLAEPTLPLLAAAGHAPIALYLLHRVSTTSRSPLALIRPLVRELARAPQPRVTWTDSFAAPDGTESALSAALARTPRLGLPGNDFIFPLVHQVDANNVASGLIGSTLPRDPNHAASATLRVAAHSMLQDDPAFTPYGWTHCLTLPQAILELLPWFTDHGRAAAVAATYVVAFRAGESRADLDLQWIPEPVADGLIKSLRVNPASAAAAWYHASEQEVANALPVLVGRAASHEDAHFAKYTLACLAAAARDPGARRLYLAAAASLAAWWATDGLDVSGFDDDR